MRQQWDPAYLEYMDRLQQEKPVVYCGDLMLLTKKLIWHARNLIVAKKFTQEERDGFSAM